MIEDIKTSSIVLDSSILFPNEELRNAFFVDGNSLVTVWYQGITSQAKLRLFDLNGKISWSTPAGIQYFPIFKSTGVGVLNNEVFVPRFEYPSNGPNTIDVLDLQSGAVKRSITFNRGCRDELLLSSDGLINARDSSLSSFWYGISVFDGSQVYEKEVLNTSTYLNLQTPSHCYVFSQIGNTLSRFGPAQGGEVWSTGVLQPFVAGAYRPDYQVVGNYLVTIDQTENQANQYLSTIDLTNGQQALMHGYEFYRISRTNRSWNNRFIPVGGSQILCVRRQVSSPFTEMALVSCADNSVIWSTSLSNDGDVFETRIDGQVVEYITATHKVRRSLVSGTLLSKSSINPYSGGVPCFGASGNLIIVDSFGRYVRFSPQGFVEFQGPNNVVNTSLVRFCSELPNGNLLVVETDSAKVVSSLTGTVVNSFTFQNRSAFLAGSSVILEQDGGFGTSMILALNSTDLTGIRNVSYSSESLIATASILGTDKVVVTTRPRNNVLSRFKNDYTVFDRKLNMITRGSKRSFFPILLSAYGDKYVDVSDRKLSVGYTATGYSIYEFGQAGTLSNLSIRDGEAHSESIGNLSESDFYGMTLKGMPNMSVDFEYLVSPSNTGDVIVNFEGSAPVSGGQIVLSIYNWKSQLFEPVASEDSGTGHSVLFGSVPESSAYINAETSTIKVNVKVSYPRTGSKVAHTRMLIDRISVGQSN